MVVGTAIMGKPSPAPVEGDALTGFFADLTQAQLDAFFDATDPHTEAPSLLRDATTRIVYDLDRFIRTRQDHPNDPTKWRPACAATLARETHVSSPLPPQGLRIQLSFSYSDGFGREIQKKIQAEPGPLDVNDPKAPVVDPRWVGSGWSVFNNKGKPVRQYEPFFSETHDFEFGVLIGVSPVLFYDPAERVIATLHPNHTYEKAVFDPWQQTIYDINDTCAQRNGQTGDPRTDPDIQGYVAEYFKTQPATWQTWHAQRIGGSMGTHERDAAQRAAAHADTPTTTHCDALGRPFLMVARNRVVCEGHDLDGAEDSIATHIELDIEGNERAVRDERKLPVNCVPKGALEQRVVMRYSYDMLGNRIHQLSMEAGARWMLNDVAGKPIRAWDSRGHNFTTNYDALRRPIEQNVRGTFSDPDPLKPNSDPRTLNHDILVDKIEYGEPPPNATDAQEKEAQRLNLRTRIYRHFDSAGVATNARLDDNGNPTEAYDFKGNLLRITRQLVSDYKAIPDWLTSPQLEAETFEGSTRYDALNRPIQSIAPHSSLTRAKLNVIQPVFNEANLLERVDVWLERAAEPGALLDPNTEQASPVGVANIDYDAKGQRLLIEYKNGSATRYRYDPETFRLVHLYTRRGAAFTEDCDNPTPPPPTIAAPETPPPGKPCGLQNLHYTYDPAGNITHIQDDAQQKVYFRNQCVESSNDYVYDALYRLIQATGREHLGQLASGERKPPTAPDAFNTFHTRLDHPGDGNAMGTYIERYVYDAVGNFLQMQHRGSDPAHPGWTRRYTYSEPSLIEGNKQSNRLSSTKMGNGIAAGPETYLHDTHGNMARMPHLGGPLVEPNMHWDFKDQFRQTDLCGGGTAWYVYDTSGQRVRKVWEKSPGLTEEHIYLGGFEIYRKHGGPIGPDSATLERETLHVMDDKQRIALVETRMLDTAGDDKAPRQLIRYQCGNHLSSASLEVDEVARIITYEEYAPYGSSTYQAVRSQTETSKQFRYTGKERDVESGFLYHGARYSAPWLGRWISSDPAGIADGPNSYLFAEANPISFTDPLGLWTWKGVWAETKNSAKAGAGAVYGAGKVIVGGVLGVGQATYYTTSKVIYDATGSAIWKEQAETYDRGIKAIAKTFEGGAVEAGKDYIKSRGDRFMAAADAGDYFAAGEAFGAPAMELALLADAASNGPKISVSPVPAMATTTGRIMQAGGKIVMTAPATGPLAMAMATASTNAAQEPAPSKPEAKTPKKMTRQFSGDKVPYQVTGLEKDLKAVKGTSVYVLKDAQGTVLYVGEGNVFDRLRAHISDPEKTPWFGEISRVEVHATELLKKESLALEEDLIAQLNPLYNKQATPFEDAFPGQLRGADLPRAQRVMRFDVNMGKK